jgi:hypothetical protein
VLSSQCQALNRIFDRVDPFLKDDLLRAACSNFWLAEFPTWPIAELGRSSGRAGLVFKPDFDRRRLGQSFKMSLQRAREVFLKAPTVRSS